MADVFLDTNVLAYRFDASEPAKRDRAVRLMNDPAHRFVVSTQVLLELYSVITRKLVPAVTPREARRALERLTVLPVVSADARLVLRASSTVELHQLSIWDAMIIEAAAEFGCRQIWSEDLSTGASLRGVAIVNPFET